MKTVLRELGLLATITLLFGYGWGYLKSVEQQLKEWDKL
jgi:hypothetical protein